MPRAILKRKAVGPGRAKVLGRDWGADANAAGLVAACLEKRKAVGREIFELSEIILRIYETEAYRAAGWETFELFLRENKIAGRSTAFKLMAVVKHNPRPSAFDRGVEHAYGVFRFSTLEDEMRALGIDPQNVLKDIDVEQMSARQLEELNRRLAAALHPTPTPTPGPTPPVNPPPPNRPKTEAARKLQASLRKAGARRAIVSSFRYEGVDWVKIKLPESQIAYVDPGG